MKAAEGARVTLVGTIRDREQLDAQGFAATLVVERVLAGSPLSGNTVRIGWEELASRRPARFADGDRIALALTPLPGQSLWRQRFPKADALAVAAKGDAFLRDPDSETLLLLTRYLALQPAERGEREGVRHLVSMVVGADLAIADAALRRLDEIAGLATRLGEAEQSRLAGVLASKARPPAFQRGLLELAGRRELRGMRAEVAKWSQPGSQLEASALVSLSALDGGLGDERIAALLAREDAPIRKVAVGLARGTALEARVGELISADPDADVRAMAVERWVTWKRQAALEAAEPALFDTDRSVRGHAAKVIGSLGSAVVPRLVKLIDGRSVEQALGPLAALSFAGREGIRALQKIARSHPDPDVQKLAKIALGQKLKRH